MTSRCKLMHRVYLIGRLLELDDAELNDTRRFWNFRHRRFPQGLRDKIYEHLLERRESATTPGQFNKLETGIMATSRRIQSEAESVFYGKNRFELSIEYNRPVDSTILWKLGAPTAANTLRKSFKASEMPASIAKMRHLRVSLDLSGFRETYFVSRKWEETNEMVLQFSRILNESRHDMKTLHIHVNGSPNTLGPQRQANVLWPTLFIARRHDLALTWSWSGDPQASQVQAILNQQDPRAVADEYRRLCGRRDDVASRLHSLQRSGVWEEEEIQWFRSSKRACSVWTLDSRMDQKKMREASEELDATECKLKALESRDAVVKSLRDEE